MRAFIVGPFRTQHGIDFEAGEPTLIGALESLGIEGPTTAEIVEAGSIREGMFQHLLTSDLVVADISIHKRRCLLRTRHTRYP
jgi:hypothetical protein